MSDAISIVGQARQRADELRAAHAPAAAQAEAWLAVAEAEPCFRWRGDPARAALADAIALLPIAGRPDLDARAALRRAELELAADQVVAARALADAATVAAERAELPVRAIRARLIAARAGLRDPALADAAAGELALIASVVAASDDDGPGGDRAEALALGAELAIAFAEQQLAGLDVEGAAQAYAQAEAVVREAGDAARPDARFLAWQGVALTAQLTGSIPRAADRVRSIVRLVNGHVAPRDELEARLALGHLLTQLGNHDEAMRHLDLARALARHAAGVDERILATQSAALAALHAKAYGRALERAYEALQLAGLEQRDLSSYLAAVSLIAQIHLARNNTSEAYLALLYGSASVRQRLGPHAALLLDAQIEELKRAMGPARFEAMCEAIVRAREARGG